MTQTNSSEIGVFDSENSPIPADKLKNRPLHFLWVVDASSSMAGEKINALNAAIRDALPEVRAAAADNPEMQVEMGAIAFSTGAKWLTNGFTPIEQFMWPGVTAGGAGDMGEAFKLVTEFLRDKMPRRAIPPASVLLSDGQPTDEYQPALQELLDLPWGKRAVRLAIAIGTDAERQPLEEFVNNTEIPVLSANSPAELAAWIRHVFASVTPWHSYPKSEFSEWWPRKPVPDPPPPPDSKPDPVW